MMVGPFQKIFLQFCALAAGDGDGSSLSSRSNNFLENLSYKTQIYE